MTVLFSKPTLNSYFKEEDGANYNGFKKTGHLVRQILTPLYCKGCFPGPGGEMVILAIRLIPVVFLL